MDIPTPLVTTFARHMIASKVLFSDAFANRTRLDEVFHAGHPQRELVATILAVRLRMEGLFAEHADERRAGRALGHVACELGLLFDHASDATGVAFNDGALVKHSQHHETQVVFEQLGGEVAHFVVSGKGVARGMRAGEAGEVRFGDEQREMSRHAFEAISVVRFAT